MKRFKYICTLPIALTSAIIPLTSCSADKKFDEFFIKYSTDSFSDWFDAITDDKNYDIETNDNSNCATEAQALMMYSYGGGWSCWNAKLHSKGETEMTEDEKNVVETYNLNLPSRTVTTKIKVGTYQLVDSALNKSHCKPVTVYSGSELDQVDLFSQINNLLGCSYDFKTTDPQLYRKLDLSKLINKTLTNYGFMSTSLKKSWAWYYTYNETSGGFKNVVFYDIDIDSSIKCGMVSDWNHRYGKNNIMLGFKHEYELILQRKLKLTIKDAYWTRNIGNKNVLYLKCTASNS